VTVGAGQSSDVKNSGTNVLVVDDDAAVRSVTSRALKMFGYEVTQAVDGLDGLERFKGAATPFALVLLDLTMPRMDGEATFRAIRELNETQAVILMTGFSEDEARSRFAGLGVSAFLEKPFDISKLRETVEALIS
jgi:CheY-like chemotaxis protein